MVANLFVVNGCEFLINMDTKTLDELDEIKDKISNEFSKIIAYEKPVQVVGGWLVCWKFWCLGFSDFPQKFKLLDK